MEKFVVTGTYCPPAAVTTKMPPQEAPQGPRLLPQAELNRALVETILQQGKEIESLKNDLRTLQARLDAIEGRTSEK
jgi:hypothetical protein